MTRLRVAMATTVLCASSFVCNRAPPPTASQPIEGVRYTVGDWTVRVRLLPDKAAVMIGEPIYLRFEIGNESDVDAHLLVGGSDRNRLGRSGRFDVVATRSDGTPVPVPDAGQTRGGMNTLHSIPAGKRYTKRLFLPNWAEFDRPGWHTLTCKRTLQLYRVASIHDGRDETPVQIPTIVQAKIHVMPHNRFRMRPVIAVFGERMLGDDVDDAERAVRALAYINDERTIPFFLEAIETRRQSVLFRSIGALGRFNSDRALQGLKRAASFTAQEMTWTTTDAVATAEADRMRHVAAGALARSPHPAARALLLSMRTDASSGVRNTVLHALGKMPAAEAQRYLDLLSQEASDAR